MNKQKAEDIIQSALANLLTAAINYGTVGVEFILHNGRIRKINYSTTDKRQEEVS